MMLYRISQVHAALVAGWERVGATGRGGADWSRGSGCFLVAGSDAWRGPD